MSIRDMLLSLCACALIVGSGQNADAQDKVTFASSSTSMLNLPVYVADVLGYFAEQKIEPEIVVFKNGGATALAAVLGGNADVYIGAPSSALGAANKGADAMVFGAIMTEVALDIIAQKEVAAKAGLTAASSVLARFRALKGLKIGVTGAGSATHQIAQYALKTAGLDPERDATIVFVNSNEDMQAAYLSKRVDALVTANPTSVAMVKDGSFLLANGAAGDYATLQGMASLVLVATKKWLSARPDRATRLLIAIKSAEAAIHDPEVSKKARDLVQAKYFAQLDKEIFASAWEAVMPAIPVGPRLADDTIQRNIEFLKEFSDQRYSIAPEKVFTNAYQPK
jgi:NitT/TauT family transport system substrate-binding protein